MSNQNKILLKQTLLLISISVLFLFLGFFANEDSLIESLAEYVIFYAYFFLMIIIFTPISIFYYLRIKRNISLTGLNITFKIFCWLLISTLLAFFILGIYENISMFWEDLSELNIFWRLWVIIKYIDKSQIIEILYYTPTLIFVGLLYWAVRINKSFDIKSN